MAFIKHIKTPDNTSYDIADASIDQLGSTKLNTGIVGNKENVANYIASRGENLLTNGTCLLTNNYNFSFFTYDGSDTYYAGGCFKKTNFASYATFTNDELIPVDVNQKYRFDFYTKTDTTGAQVNGCMKAFDIDGNEIGSYQVAPRANTLTYLTQALNQGDTVIHFNSIANFATTSLSGNNASLLFYGYKNSYGYEYPPETYTRYRYTALWSNASQMDFTNNTITLNSAWSGPNFPVNTPVSQGQDGSGALYCSVDDIATTCTLGHVGEWEHHWYHINGLQSKNAFPQSQFPFGTAFIKVGLMNRPTGAGQTFKISTLSFSSQSSSDVGNGKLTLTQNGSSVYFYANQSGNTTASFTDNKVYQEASSSDTTYPILFKNTSGSATVTAGVRYDSLAKLTYNPSTNILTVPYISIEEINKGATTTTSGNTKTTTLKVNDQMVVTTVADYTGSSQVNTTNITGVNKIDGLTIPTLSVANETLLTNNTGVTLDTTQTISGQKTFSANRMYIQGETHFSAGAGTQYDYAYGYGVGIYAKNMMANLIYTPQFKYRTSAMNTAGKGATTWNLPYLDSGSTYTLATTQDIPIAAYDYKKCILNNSISTTNMPTIVDTSVGWTTISFKCNGTTYTSLWANTSTNKFFYSTAGGNVTVYENGAWVNTDYKTIEFEGSIPSSLKTWLLANGRIIDDNPSSVKSTSSIGESEHYARADHVHSLDSTTIASVLGYSPENPYYKVSSWSSTPDNTHYPSEKLVKDELDDIREVAEGKSATYVISTTNNSDFDSQSSEIEVAENLIDVDGNTVALTDLNKGDVILVKETNVPDRWVSANPSASLPSGYTRVEYIEGTGTQYIDTGIVLTTTNFNLILDVQHVGEIVTTNFDSSLAGFMATSTTPRMGVHIYSGAYMYGVNTTTSASSTLFPPNNDRHKIVLTNSGSTQYLFIDNVQASSTGLTTSALDSNDLSLYLFARNAASMNIARMKMYKAILTVNGVEYKFIPCIQTSTNEAGLYDVNHNVFYGPKMAGTHFNAGNTITTTTEFSILESTAVDLSDYYTKSETNALVSVKANTAYIGVLNTNNTTSQASSISTNESFYNHTINLHKIAKTGSYGDLLDKPTIPSDYVNLSTDQTISGTKTFTQRPRLEVTRLPSTYQEVTYIESNGTPYIDTGMPIHMGWTYKLIFQQNNTSQYRGWGVFNQESYNGGLNMSLTYGSSAWMVRWETRNGYTECVNLPTIDTNKHELYIDDGEVWFDNVDFGKTPVHDSSVVSSYNGFLFTINPGGTNPTGTLNGRIYSYQVWDNNGTLQQNFVPCYRKTDGVRGFYDLVNSVFKTNANSSGTFTIGETVTDSNFLVAADLDDVAFSGDYNDLDNKPSIPTTYVTNAQIAAGVNGASIQPNNALFVEKTTNGTYSSILYEPLYAKIQSLASNDNLNNFKTAGIWYTISSAVINSLSNKPSVTGGECMLEVRPMGASNYTMQIFSWKSGTSLAIWVRTQSAGTWGSWKPQPLVNGTGDTDYLVGISSDDKYLYRTSKKLSDLALASSVPTKTSELTNDGHDGTHAFIDTEDIKYTNANGTTIAVGGIPAGTTFDNKSVVEILEDMLYPYVAFTFSSFTTTPSATTYEYGASKTITKVTPTFTLGSKSITSVKVGKTSGASDLYSGNTATSGTAITLTNSYTIPGTSNVNVYVEISDGTTATTKSVTFAFSKYYYYTVTSSTTIPTTATAIGTGSQKDITTTNNTYIWFLSPTSKTKIQQYSMNMWNDMTTTYAGTTSFTTQTGQTLTYYAYRSPLMISATGTYRLI